jgi:hypothetical protein
LLGVSVETGPTGRFNTVKLFSSLRRKGETIGKSGTGDEGLTEPLPDGRTTNSPPETGTDNLGSRSRGVPEAGENVY